MKDREPTRQVLVKRRVVVGGLLLAALGGGVATTRASPVIGKAMEIRGDVRRRQAEEEEALAVGAQLFDNDHVRTQAESFATLALGTDTRVLLGAETDLLVDRFIAGQGGTLELGTGRMVFDRPEGLPKVDVAVRTAFGMIGVRGTKFFCGPQGRLCRFRRAWQRCGRGGRRHADCRGGAGRRVQAAWRRPERPGQLGTGADPRSLCQRRAIAVRQAPQPECGEAATPRRSKSAHCLPPDLLSLARRLAR